MDITIAVQPASKSSDLKEDSFDETSTPAYLISWTLIGFIGGFGLESPQISSTRLISYRKTSSWFFLEIASFSSSVASDEKRYCSLQVTEVGVTLKSDVKNFPCSLNLNKRHINFHCDRKSYLFSSRCLINHSYWTLRIMDSLKTNTVT